MKLLCPARSLLSAAALAGLLLCALFVAPRAGYADVSAITDYRVISQTGVGPGGKPLVAIRSLRRDGIPLFLTVDPYTLETALRPVSQVSLLPAPPWETLSGTPYLTALEHGTAPPCRLQNHGAVRGAGDGIFLTVDLCPSKRQFERELFLAAEAAAQAHGYGKGAPVAVAISGLWLENHPEELAFLKGESAAGRLSITWVNHSYHHVYAPKTPLERNFLLTPGTNFDAEVLELERLLLAHGLTPSPFFRFPGLVADTATMKRLRELSLIPVGSEAWLAKGEHPRQGSIVLVHGNGNEPKGIALALPILRTGRWRLLPLAAAFANDQCPVPNLRPLPQEAASVPRGATVTPPKASF
ncbi:polysaccharide deacetylase [Geomonas sp. RF6]|uniref:polysaccharide deacetylase n=1 Tax=Geomonas sp. RF6 TaxID=2897342 RepID=UPI001E43043C|nr:polysaccharide deacetylase [Geomonas sp. RF6]UFS71552.1 polysaccharide deacetylase [Geomonas sp. RF6]